MRPRRSPRAVRLRSPRSPRRPRSRRAAAPCAACNEARPGWGQHRAIGIAAERRAATRLKDSLFLSRVDQHCATEMAMERRRTTRLNGLSRLWTHTDWMRRTKALCYWNFMAPPGARGRHPPASAHRHGPAPAGPAQVGCAGVAVDTAVPANPSWPRVLEPQPNSRPSARTKRTCPPPSRRRDCHSAAPPSLFTRRFNRGEEGVPAR